MYDISVIVPVYNAEKYLERTIRSVINQTLGFENIQLIMVDDFSSDSSRKIMKEYSDKYPNVISIFSNENHGYPGYGRNTGIEKSDSKYIMFLDNDDEYPKDYCEVMFNTIESENVDVVCTNHTIKYQFETVKRDTFTNIAKQFDMEANSGTILLDLTKLHYVQGPEIWTKIFKSSIIKDNDIRFIEKGLNEDKLFLYNYYLHADSYLVKNYYGYIWYENGDHLSSHSVKSASLFIDSYYLQHDFITQNYENVDANKEIAPSVEGIIASTVLASNDKKDRLFLIEKLYDFEKYIKFDEKLPHLWGRVINKFILKNKFGIVLFMMGILSIGVKILFFAKKMLNKIH